MDSGKYTQQQVALHDTSALTCVETCKSNYFHWLIDSYQYRTAIANLFAILADLCIIINIGSRTEEYGRSHVVRGTIIGSYRRYLARACRGQNDLLTYCAIVANIKLRRIKSFPNVNVICKF